MPHHGPPRDRRTTEEFAAALWRETDRSIAEDLRRYGEVRRRRGTTLGKLPRRNAAYDGRRFDPRSETRQERILALLAEAGPKETGYLWRLADPIPTSDP